MATASREYVAHWPAGEWRAAADRLVTTLRAWNAAARRVNWDIRWLESVADADEEDVPVAEVVARGGFPVAWINLTFDPDRLSTKELAGVEQGFELRQYAGAVSRVSYFAEPGPAADRSRD
jgi:hypothetical protein